MVSQIFSLIGADPSLFAGILLPIDMGGYSMAVNLAQNR